MSEIKKLLQKAIKEKALSELIRKDKPQEIINTLRREYLKEEKEIELIRKEEKELEKEIEKEKEKIKQEELLIFKIRKMNKKKI